MCIDVIISRKYMITNNRIKYNNIRVKYDFYMYRSLARIYIYIYIYIYILQLNRFARDKGRTDMAKNLSGLPNQDGVPDTDMDAYKQDYEAHRAGISTEECIKYYNRTAEKYEQVNNE